MPNMDHHRPQHSNKHKVSQPQGGSHLRFQKGLLGGAPHKENDAVNLFDV